jgi:rSAM/selenodomain-associated transferase 1
MPRDVLCILAKAPRPGEVKTRLAPAVGEAGAATLARAFFDDTLALTRRMARARLALAMAGDATPLGLPADLEVWPQAPGDLGERMERALARALTIGDRVLLIGADSPGLPRAYLEAAFTLLSSHDAVLGPADDGGFYLLGLDRCEPGLLSGLPWSQSDALLRTEARLRATGRTVGHAPPWFDVDELDDLLLLSGLIARGAVDAPATARALASMRLLVSALP